MSRLALWVAAVIGAALVLIAILMLARPARSATLSCADRARVLEELLDHYGERPVGGGGDATGERAVLLVGPHSWTVVLIVTGDLACLLASGQLEIGAGAPGKEL